MAKTFIDTNVFVYALDQANPVKHASARAWIRRLSESGQGVVSTQVLQEFFSIVTRKLGHPPLAAKQLLQALSEFELVVVDLPIIEKAIDLSILNPVSFWDGLVLAAAGVANCSEVLTEDLSAG